MLKFLVIVHNATKGFDTMKTIKVTEDDENEFPATMTPTQKTKEDFDRNRMTLYWLRCMREGLVPGDEKM